MKKAQVLLAACLLAIISSSFIACGGDDDPTSQVEPTPKVVNVESVSINTSTLNLIEGDSQSIVVTIFPMNATNKKYSFSSSNPEVASVDDNGKITALKAGETIITVTSMDGNKTATCNVKVEAKYIAVTSITLDNTSVTLKVGEKIKINASVTPEDATDPTLTWEASNTDIISVDKEGNVEALKLGEAEIIVYAENKSIKATCKISVIPEAVTGISLSDGEIKLMPGDSRQLIAIIEPDNADDKSVTWSIKDSSIASVDQNGLVTAKKIGETTVTVTTKDGEFTATCTINVVDITGMILAEYFVPGSVYINGVEFPSKNIYVCITNESNSTIILDTFQVIDGQTSIGGNLIGLDYEELASGKSKTYSLTTSTYIKYPIVRLTFGYNKERFSIDCQEATDISKFFF